MENEQVVETTPVEGAGESATSQEESTQPEQNESEQTSEPTIPHGRVKEMVDKAKLKGREEALRELLKEEDTSHSQPEPVQPKAQPQPLNEREEAVKILRDVVRQEVSPILARQEAEKFLENNPDSLEYIDKIKALRKENKGLNWDQAYKLASYEDKLASAKTVGVKQREQNIVAKQAAATEKPGNVPPPQKKQSFAERVKDRRVPLSQIEQELKQKLTGN